MKRNKLKQMYYKDENTFGYWKDENGKPTEEYTKWVENKLMEQLALCSVVGQSEQLFCEDCQKWVGKKCSCGNKELARDETY